MSEVQSSDVTRKYGVEAPRNEAAPSLIFGEVEGFADVEKRHRKKKSRARNKMRKKKRIEENGPKNGDRERKKKETPEKRRKERSSVANEIGHNFNQTLVFSSISDDIFKN